MFVMIGLSEARMLLYHGLRDGIGASKRGFWTWSRWSGSSTLNKAMIACSKFQPYPNKCIVGLIVSRFKTLELTDVGGTRSRLLIFRIASLIAKS
jgi:hypothetical protein